MFAVVTELREKRFLRKVILEPYNEFVHFKVGYRVGALKLKKSLLPYSQNVVFAKGVSTRGIIPFDSSEFREKLLFRLFADYCLLNKRKIKTVGVVNADDWILRQLSTILSHVENTVLYSNENLDDYISLWMAETGTYPEIVTSKALLYDCDVLFSPKFIAGYTGVLFGKGGIQPKQTDVTLPDVYKNAIMQGVDALDIAAVISYNKKDSFNLNSKKCCLH